MKKIVISLSIFGYLHAVVFIEKALSYDDVLLVPQKSTVASRKHVETATKLTKNITLSMPIISSNMDTVTESAMAIAMAQLGGIGIIHRFNTIEQQVEEVIKVKEHLLLVGAAIGVKADAIERATALIAAGVDVLVIDIAHGHSDLALTTLKAVKEKHPDIDIIVGNVVTAQATRELIQAGADAIKVGVGPGSICTTRIVSGCGYPQLSALINCCVEADKYGIPVIADGGIKCSGDITKAIAAGASTVMLGNLLAGTAESPGQIITQHDKKYKVIRGMASREAYSKRPDTPHNNTDHKNYVPEGVEGLTPYKGPVADTITQLLGGLFSGMSYCGVTTLADLRGNGIFVEITAAGIRESHAHDIIKP